MNLLKETPERNISRSNSMNSETEYPSLYELNLQTQSNRSSSENNSSRRNNNGVNTKSNKIIRKLYFY